MSKNPYEPFLVEPSSAGKEANSNQSDHNDAYNIVSDTVIGINARKSDNQFQALFVFVSSLLFAAVVAIAAIFNPSWHLPWYGGALIGAFVGMVVGVFASGIFLMFYRAARHLKGKHD